MLFVFRYLISDPQDPFKLDSLVYNITFLEAIQESMNDDSVLVSQVGIAPKITDPDETYSPRHSTRVKFIDNLNGLGFEKILNYETVSYKFGSCCSLYPESYNGIFKRVNLT